jgi:hypothetical protein
MIVIPGERARLQAAAETRDPVSIDLSIPLRWNLLAPGSPLRGVRDDEA